MYWGGINSASKMTGALAPQGEAFDTKSQDGRRDPAEAIIRGF
jgi:hypothetical protein